MLIRLFQTFILAMLPLTAALSHAAPATAVKLDRPITDDIFYFMMTDRFADGDKANNKGRDSFAVDAKDSREDVVRHGFEPTQESFYHGGDFRGVMQKLDYLQGLGVTAIWLSPVMKNRATQVGESPFGVIAGYHGYWINDFTTVDPHLGSEDDFKNLIEAAHSRGMKVFIDVIVNHTADHISYRECKDCPYRSRADFPYATTRKGKKLNPGFVDGDLSEANYQRFKDPDYAYTPFLPDPKLRKQPEWLNEFVYYHNRGNSTFSGENSELGDFFGLDDLNTEHPRVVSGMIDIYKDWIKKYRFDGFRVDTVKHVNIEFWQQFVPAMRAAAKAAGLPHFYIFGEVFSADPAILSHYTEAGKMNTVLDFALHGAMKDVFADGQSPEKLHEALEKDDLHRRASSPQEMMTFLSNHDIGRLAYFMKNALKDASDGEILKRLTLAHAFLYFARGVPVLYYGDEQGFVGLGGDKGAREDMMPSKTPSYMAIHNVGSSVTPAQDNFNTQHPLYLALSKMAVVYQAHPLLRTGEYTPVRDLGPGIFAFRRSAFAGKEAYIVAFNLDPSKSQTIKWPEAGYQAVYPQAASKTASTLEPLSFAIFKGPQLQERMRLKADFKDLVDGQRIAGLTFAALDLPTQRDFKVTFATRRGKEAFKLLYVDFNAPYRAYIDADRYPNGTELTLRAEIDDGLGPKTTLTRRLVIDSRPPIVNVHYENGHKRQLAFHISQSGRIALAQALGAENLYRFDWPLDEDSQTLFFSSKGEDSSWNYDRPVRLSYREHILPHIKPGPAGAPGVTLYISNRGEISASPQPPQAAEANRAVNVPKTLPAPFADKTIYIRGGMNTWQAKDVMAYKGFGTYEAEVILSAGRMEFKFADQDWTATSNLGAPYTAKGLTASGGSGNLSYLVPAGAEGRYRVQLSFLPGADADSSISLFRLEKL